MIFLEHTAIFSVADKKKCNETKVVEEYYWAITRVRCGGHNAGDHVPVCWSMEYSWIPLYIHIQYLYIYINKQWKCVCVCADLNV